MDEAQPAWDAPGTVEGFVRSPPNGTLMRYAAALRRSGRRTRVLDIGCGAARNAAPLATAGLTVTGTDLSWPMLTAAAKRVAAGRMNLLCAPMDALPLSNRSCDLIVAHGIWNLARSGSEFRRAVAEAARVAAARARLFVSRSHGARCRRTCSPSTAKRSSIADSPIRRRCFSRASN